MVWSDAVPQPVAVRYAWADSPMVANLFNVAGLPDSPSKTVQVTTNQSIVYFLKFLHLAGIAGRYLLPCGLICGSYRERIWR